MTRVVDEVICGLYKRRRSRLGPFDAVQIAYRAPIDPLVATYLDRSPQWELWVNGKLEQVHRTHEPLAGICNGLTPVSPREYDRILFYHMEDYHD